MKQMHVSFDDVWRCLHDVSTADYASVFENVFLAELCSLHRTYGAVFTLYCFCRCDDDAAYDIANLPNRYARELSECAAWLKFGFHAASTRTNYGDGSNGTSTGGDPLGDCPEQAAADYRHFAQAIQNAHGSIDPIIRPGFFACTAANVRAFRACGVTGLLTADDNRVSCHLTADENRELLCIGDMTLDGLRLIRSQKRLEKVEEQEAFHRQLMDFPGQQLEVFTHEQNFTPEVSGRLDACLRFAKECGWRFAFAEN